MCKEFYKLRGTTLKHKSQETSARVTEQHQVLGGKAIILRTAASGDVWQFRMWVSEEKKYVRKTLKTRDLETAMRRAEELYLHLYSDIVSGRKLFGLSLADLIETYLKWREKDVAAGIITAGRLVTLSSQLKHVLEYKGTDIGLSELDRNSFYDYAQFRRLNSDAQNVTIRNEQVTINHMMKFAYRNGYSQFERFEFAAINLREEGRRDTFTLKEYDALIRYLGKWCSIREIEDEHERRERLLMRDAILIASNTMLRVGELWQLRWGDILDYEDAVDEAGEKAVLVTLKVRAEIAKTRKSRVITTRGGEYFKRLHSRTVFRDKLDYVFCGESGRERFSRRKFYDAWSHLMSAIGIDYKQRNLTWYSLRHFGITNRLRAGASVFVVAKVAGCSAIHIEKHYGHVDQGMERSVALKNV